jgi:hypothetical protein
MHQPSDVHYVRAESHNSAITTNSDEDLFAGLDNRVGSPLAWYDTGSGA